MRLNRYLASATGISRRAADNAITEGRAAINGQVAVLGSEVTPSDKVTLDGDLVAPAAEATYIVLHKPAGYVTSRRQQGASSTVYALLPPELHRLKTVGRLDRDTSGLLLLTDDGAVAHRLTHPSFQKTKRYELTLDRAMSGVDLAHLKNGVELEDGLSKFDNITGVGSRYTVELTEGRNRQIRRTFLALGYRVITLHRTQFGSLKLGTLKSGQYRTAAAEELA